MIRERSEHKSSVPVTSRSSSPTWAATTALVCLLVCAAAAAGATQTTDANDANSIGQQIDIAQKKLFEVQEILNNLRSLFTKQQQPQQTIDVGPQPPEIVANLQPPANLIEAPDTLGQPATSATVASNKSQTEHTRDQEPASSSAQVPPQTHQESNLQPTAAVPAQLVNGEHKPEPGQLDTQAPPKELPASNAPSEHSPEVQSRPTGEVALADESEADEDGDGEGEEEDEDEVDINGSEASETGKQEPAGNNKDDEAAPTSVAPETMSKPELISDVSHLPADAAEQSHQIEERNSPTPAQEVIEATTEGPVAASPPHVAPAQSIERQQAHTFAAHPPHVQANQALPQEAAKNDQANQQQQQQPFEPTNNNGANPTQQDGVSPKSSFNQQPNPSASSRSLEVTQLANAQRNPLPYQIAPLQTETESPPPQASESQLRNHEIGPEAMKSSPASEASEPAKTPPGTPEAQPMERQQQQQQQHREEQKSQPSEPKQPEQTLANPFSSWRQLFESPAKLISTNYNQQAQNPLATDKRPTHEQPGVNYGQMASGSGLVNQDAENRARQQQQQPRTSTFSLPKLPSLTNPFSSGGQKEPTLNRTPQQQRPLSALGGNSNEGLIPQQHGGQDEETFVFKAERDPNAPPPHRRLRKFRRFLRHPKSTLTSFVHKHHEHHDESGDQAHDGDGDGGHLHNKAQQQPENNFHLGQLGGTDQEHGRGGLGLGASGPKVSAGRLHELWDRFKANSLVSGAVGKFQTHVAPHAQSAREQATHALEKVRDGATTSHRAKRRRLSEDDGEDERQAGGGRSSSGFPFPTQRVVPDMLGRLPQVPPVHLRPTETETGKQLQQTSWHQHKQANAASHQERLASLPEGGRSFRRQTSSSHMTSSHSI